MRNRWSRARGGIKPKSISEIGMSLFKTMTNLPPPVTPSDEEPIAAGGWSFF
jgi:hypothetical protein